jgi:hypothetical protein
LLLFHFSVLHECSGGMHLRKNHVLVHGMYSYWKLNACLMT